MINKLADAYSYSLIQWLFFFYLYCFIGWVWETCYVSIKDGKFQNRGFMNGPFLPIYGSGAIVILMTTLPFRENAILVFLFGMIGSTLLELATGIVMEELFKVKYWDYSNQPFNYKGHICLKSSIAWGVASILMMYVVHRPIERAVLNIPEKILNPITLVLAVYITADFSTSFKAALDLKDFLVSFDRVKVELSDLQKRIAMLENKSVTNLLKRNPHAVSKDYGAALNEYRDIFVKRIKDSIEEARETIEIIEEKLEDTKEAINDRIEDTRERIADTKDMIEDRLEDAKEALEEKVSETIDAINDKIEDKKEFIDGMKKS